MNIGQRALEILRSGLFALLALVIAGIFFWIDYLLGHQAWEMFIKREFVTIEPILGRYLAQWGFTGITTAHLFAMGFAIGITVVITIFIFDLNNFLQLGEQEILLQQNPETNELMIRVTHRRKRLALIGLCILGLLTIGVVYADALLFANRLALYLFENYQGMADLPSPLRLVAIHKGLFAATLFVGLIIAYLVFKIIAALGLERSAFNFYNNLQELIGSLGQISENPVQLPEMLPPVETAMLDSVNLVAHEPNVQAQFQPAEDVENPNISTESIPLIDNFTPQTIYTQETVAAYPASIASQPFTPPQKQSGGNGKRQSTQVIERSESTVENSRPQAAPITNELQESEMNFNFIHQPSSHLGEISIKSTTILNDSVEKIEQILGCTLTSPVFVLNGLVLPKDKPIGQYAQDGANIEIEEEESK